MQGIYDHLDAVAAKGTRKKLEEGRESAFLSLELARMRFDAPSRSTGRRSDSRACRPRSLTCSSGATSSEPRAPAGRATGSRGGELPTPERLAVRLSEEPIEPSFEPVAVAPVGDGRWAVAVAEDEVRISEGLPDRLRVHDAKKVGAGAHFDTFLAAYLIKPAWVAMSWMPSPRSVAWPTSRSGRRPRRRKRRGGPRRSRISHRGSSRSWRRWGSRGSSTTSSCRSPMLGEMEKVGMPVEARVLEEVGEEIEGRSRSWKGASTRTPASSSTSARPSSLARCFSRASSRRSGRRRPATRRTPGCCSSSPSSTPLPSASSSTES